MHLKRVFDSSSGTPVCTGVVVERAAKRQNFWPSLIEKGVAEGWLSMGAGKIALKTPDGDVGYTIARAPGLYCCHCEQVMDDSPSAARHVKTTHKDAVSPDPCNPSGYRRDNFYAAIKDGDEVVMDKAKAAALDKELRAVFAEKISKKYAAKNA